MEVVWREGETPVEFRAPKLSASYVLKLFEPIIVVALGLALLGITFYDGHNVIPVEEAPFVEMPTLYFAQIEGAKDGKSKSCISSNLPSFLHRDIVPFGPSGLYEVWVTDDELIHIRFTNSSKEVSPANHFRIFIPLRVKTRHYVQGGFNTYILFQYFGELPKGLSLVGNIRFEQLTELFPMNGEEIPVLSNRDRESLPYIQNFRDLLSSFQGQTLKANFIEKSRTETTGGDNFVFDLTFGVESLILRHQSSFWTSLRINYSLIFYCCLFCFIIVDALIRTAIDYRVFKTQKNLLIEPSDKKQD